MREDPEMEIRSVSKKIEMKLGEHKVGEYLDKPNLLQPVHPLRQGKPKPWPWHLWPTEEEPLFTWVRNKRFLGRTPTLPSSQIRRLARQGGVGVTAGCKYPNKGYGVLSKQQDWRLRVEQAETCSELALLIRDFDSSLKWVDIQHLPEEEEQRRTRIQGYRKVTLEDGDEEMEFYCSRVPLTMADHGGLPEQPPPQAQAEEFTWLPTEDVPLKLVKDFMEVYRLENSSKSDKYVHLSF